MNVCLLLSQFTLSFSHLQVSWSVPHKQASSGTYQVKFFDEEAYSALRKVWQIDIVSHLMYKVIIFVNRT